jgi:pyruvate kinase
MSAPPWHRTKIVRTLGPVTDAPDVLARMVAAGMDVARVNLSHGNAADHARRIRTVRAVAQSLGQPVAVLADLPGPSSAWPRSKRGARTLQEGAVVPLTTQPANGANLPVRNPELRDALGAGEVVFLSS